MKRFSMLISQVLAVMRAYKVRTVVAVIGVLLGAMALVVIQNISLSMNTRVENEIKEFGDRVITVYARRPYVPGQRFRARSVKTMKQEDMAAVYDVNNVINVTGTSRGSVNLKYKDANTVSACIGTTQDYFNMRGLTLSDGRIFTPEERINKDRVAVIGSSVAADMFEGVYPINEIIYVNDNPFYIIGVLEEKGTDISGKNLDNIVIVPLETAMVRIFNRHYLTELLFQMNSWDNFPVVSKDVEMVLRVQHRLAPEVVNDFEIISPKDEMEFSNTLIKLANILGTASAIIAFLIGAIGIFSLMLLIVSQRTVEIGVKRAIGATRRDILFQFVMESGSIGLMGGSCGIIVGIILSLVICSIAKLPYTVSLLGAFISFFSAFISGVLAGLYPAVKASRVSPVKALRL